MMDRDRTQPNKPGGNFKDDGEPREPEDLRAVRNQGEVSPEDYPDDADGKAALPPPPD